MFGLPGMTLTEKEKYYQIGPAVHWTAPSECADAQLAEAVMINANKEIRKLTKEEYQAIADKYPKPFIKGSTTPSVDWNPFISRPPVAGVYEVQRGDCASKRVDHSYWTGSQWNLTAASVSRALEYSGVSHKSFDIYAGLYNGWREVQNV